MSSFGRPISVSAPMDTVYDVLCSYYGNPNLIKCKDVIQQGGLQCSVYIAKISSLLNVKQFIIAFLNIDREPIGSVYPLSLIQWKSFQTRNLNEKELNSFLIGGGHNPSEMVPIPPKISDFLRTGFTYTPKRDNANSRITVQDRNENNTSYSVDKYPIIITLLHESKSLYEYPPDGNLYSALETYKTVITFK